MKTFVIQPNRGGYVFFDGTVDAARTEALRLANETNHYVDMSPMGRKGLRPQWRRIFPTAQQQEIDAMNAKFAGKT